VRDLFAAALVAAREAAKDRLRGRPL